MKVLVIIGPDVEEVDPIELRAMLRRYEEQGGFKITEVEVKRTNEKLAVSLGYSIDGIAIRGELGEPVNPGRCSKGERKRNRKERWR